jgi:hypothetical protein
MSEGTDQYTVELDEQDGPGSLDDDLVETDREHSLQDRAGTESAEESTGDGESMLSRFLSPLSLALVLVPPFLGSFLVGTLPLLPESISTVAGAVLGLFVGGFVAGLLRQATQYSEAAIGGAIIGILTAWTTNNGFDAPILGAGLVLGVLVALAGAYFGRDLRTGLTKDLG